MRPGKLRSHEDLDVWHKAIDLAADIYGIGQLLPKSELFGLVSQMRRAAVSVAANVAEGHGRRATNDFARFVAIARGSLMELHTHIVLTERTGYVDSTRLRPIFDMIAEVGRMLSGLEASLRRAAARQRRARSDDTEA